jgi:hypothetical protein
MAETLSNQVLAKVLKTECGQPSQTKPLLRFLVLSLGYKLASKPKSFVHFVGFLKHCAFLKIAHFYKICAYS